MPGAHTVRQSLLAQQRSCATNGSPLYATLLSGLIVDHDNGGLIAALLDGVSEQPIHDALPLRLLAVAHQLALDGHAPSLARHYPSCGGTWDGSSSIVGDFLDSVTREIDEMRRGMHRNVQTNEVARAAALASGFALIGRRFGLPLEQFEIGSSAALLSHWDLFHFDTGSSTLGPSQSSVQFGPEWWHDPAPQLDPVRISGRHASDISPIDVSTEAGRIRMQSFVWPDQIVRLERLRAAMDIASSVHVSVDASDAGMWLERQLASSAPADTARVVFHSIVWQYLPAATRARVRATLAEHGATATPTTPLLWLRMEPATADHADLRLTTWAGDDGVEEVLALVGYHGTDVRWSAD